MTGPRCWITRGLLLLLAICAWAVGASAQTALPMRVPVVPVGMTDLGALPGSQAITVTLYLTPTMERQAELGDFLKGVTTPGSVAYKQWLTPVEFGERFGATERQLRAVREFSQTAGFSEDVSASGLRVGLTGTVAQVEAAFAPGLHGIQSAGTTFFVNTAVPVVPFALTGDVLAIGGVTDLPGAHPLSMVWEDGSKIVGEMLGGIAPLIDANATRVLALSTDSCLQDVDTATQAAMQLALRQAGAQGITVLASSDCGTRGSAGFPSVLADVTSVAVAPGIVPVVSPALLEARPVWQAAPGLPVDAYRHEPDVTVSSVNALTAEMVSILAKEPVGANGAAARLGNIDSTLYKLAPIKGLYMQSDGAKDTWEPATGLGLVDLGILGIVYPRGSLSVNVSITLGSYYIAAGSSINVNTSVTDTSGQGGGVTPTGSVTYTVDGSTTLGTGQLANGSYSGTFSSSGLAAGSHSMNAAYSGDAKYQPITSTTINFTIAAATSTLTAQASSGAVVGGTIAITVTDVSSSGVSPIGTVSVTPQGTNDTSTYTGTLAASGTAGTSTATVSVPATQGGTDTFQASCTSSNSTCSTPANATTTVGLGTPTITLTTSPSPPVTGQNTTFTATVTAPAGTKYPVPTGNVSFYDGSNQLPSATLNAGVATMQTSSNITSSGTYTAVYGGDNNYKTVTGTAAGGSTATATTTVLTVSPNPPVLGIYTALSAQVQYTLGSFNPSGSVSFYEDGVLLGTQAITNSPTVVYLSNTISGVASHTFYAVYSGDTNFLTSKSATVTTPASSAGTIATTTAVVVSPTAPVRGTLSTLTATITPASGSVTPTGTVTFYVDGVDLAVVPMSGGVATLSLSTLSAGDTVYGVYSGDSNYVASTSPTVTAGSTSMSSATTTALTVSPNPPVSGSSTTLTATIGYTLTNGVVPTGKVSFYQDGTLLANVTVSGATAVYTSTALSGTAVHMYTAVYAGDANYTTSSAPPVTTSAASATIATTDTLTVSPNPPVSGSSTTLTATLGYTGAGSATPTGTVYFYANGLSLIGEPVSNGIATLTSAVFTPGETFYAVYSGDSIFKASTSPTVTTTSSTATTTTTLVVNPNPPVSGSATTLTAAVAYTLTNGAAPTGTVNFYEDGTLIGAGTVSGGTATYSSTTLSDTTAHTFYAVYAGDSTYKTSTSPTVATSAGSATLATTNALTISPNPPVSGTLTTLLATVGFTASGSVYPTGTMTFYEDGVALGTVTVVQSGTMATGTFTSTTLSDTKAHSFYALYSGDATYKASTSPTVATAAASVAPTTTAMTVTPNPPVSGTATTLTATIGSTSATAPTGTVSFYEDGTALTTAATVSAGAATYSSTALSSKAAHTFYAVYSGDTNNATSTSAPVATAATSTTGVTTTTTVTSSSSAVSTGQTALLTATITPSSVVNGTNPTGTVTFTSATQGVLCSATVTGGAGNCTATFTLAGTQAVSASYSGDTNYAASVSVVAAAVAVTMPTGTLALSVTPSTSVLYGMSVVLGSSVTTSAAAGTTGPTGTVTVALGGAGAASYNQTLVPTSTMTAQGTTAIAAPTPGAYTATATCTSSTFTCTGLSATASLTTIKGNTITTVTALPASPVAGQTTVFTITVAPAYPVASGTITPTGTVTFYLNGTSTIVTLLNGSATYALVLTATTGSYVTAVYSGDTNWNGSTSTQLVVLIQPVPTNISLTANATTALYRANIVLTVTLSVTPTTLTPDPASPTGTVTFYDVYNGLPSLIGTANLTQLVLGYSIAEITTTGLLPGTHNITAVYNGTTTNASSTGSILINITDFAYTFSPGNVAVSRGSGATVVTTVTSINGFAGQVVLGCSPPPSSLMTCSFTPAVVNGSGTSILSITTTAPSASLRMPGQVSRISLAAISLASLLLGLLLPWKRRGLSWLAVLVAALALGAGSGCASQSSTASASGSSGTGGTPQGTQLLSITADGTDGLTTLRIDSNYQVTVQ